MISILINNAALDQYSLYLYVFYGASASYLRYICLPLSNGLQLGRITEQHLDTELHLLLLKAEVEAGDLGTNDLLGHG